VVRKEDIFTDPEGVNTAATVRNTVPLFRQWPATRVLAVSHFYHLPRIKLAYQRHGFEVCTVPARQGFILQQIPYSVSREVAAFWAYYFRQPANTERQPPAPTLRSGSISGYPMATTRLKTHTNYWYLHETSALSVVSRHPTRV
jgi:hypothetical protein